MYALIMGEASSTVNNNDFVSGQDINWNLRLAKCDYKK